MEIYCNYIHFVLKSRKSINFDGYEIKFNERK